MKRYGILFHKILNLGKITKRLWKKSLLNQFTSYSRWKNGRPELVHEGAYINLINGRTKIKTLISWLRVQSLSLYG